MRQIKKLTKNEAEQACNLHKICFTTSWSMQAFNNLLEAEINHGWGYYEQSKFIGLIMLNLIAGESEILTLCVDPAYTRQHIGQDLLNYAITYLKRKKTKNLFLEVASGNLAALTLYKKLNFKQIYLRKQYYGIEDAVIMELNFTSKND